MAIGQFSPEGEHLARVLAHRDALVAGCISSGIPFVDDALGGIYPDDFVLLGADTGVGKTSLIVDIVKSALAVKHPHPVHAMMLEADVGEVTARLGYEELVRLADRPFDFADFWRGRVKDQEEKYWAQVQKILAPQLAQLQTLYKKSGDFTPKHLEQLLKQVGTDTRLIALDHIHMIEGGSLTDTATQQRTAELLRDYALVHKRPVVAASQLRKRVAGEQRELVPGRDNILGSKHILAKTTVIVMVARDWDGERPQPHLSPTFIEIAKDRRGRQVPFVARVYYDTLAGRYQNAYVLGRVRWKDKMQVWEPTPEKYVPHWAVREARKKAEMPF